jgi:predicted nucleic acid-binding protein
MKLYADTNFLSRLYLGLPIDEKTLAWLQSLGARNPPQIPVTWLHRSELCNAMQLYVFRTRSGLKSRITVEHSGAAWAQFREELSAGKLLATALPSSQLADEAEELALRYTARHGFRTYDLLHVASALLLGCDSFLSFDDNASQLAHLEGLKLRKC